MASLGLRQTVVTVRWLPSDPLALGERPLLDLTVAAARAAGLSVVFATYPYPTREVEAGLARPEAFGAWLGELAQRYPTVRQFVVGNEPNQPAFWRPQFSAAKQRSARTFGPFLAAGYDALKAVDPTLTVVGVGLSPRGNDRPDRQEQRLHVTRPLPRIPRRLVPGEWPCAARSWTVSASTPTRTPRPIRSTAAIRGRMRASSTSPGSSRPRGMRSPGTAQPTTVDGLRLYLDEVGWQVDTTGRTGYAGAENVAVTDEASQAVVYGELVRRAACDPDVAQVNVFGFRDDALRTGFQAGLFRADGSRATLGRRRARRGCRAGVREPRPARRGARRRRCSGRSHRSSRSLPRRSRST